MALPTITKMQKTAQEMLNKYKEQQAASTSATQSGSTSTPTTTTTPKVTSTPKAQPSVTQPTVTSQTVSTPTQPVDLTKINLFKPQETTKILTQSKNLLTQSDKVDSPTITSELAKMYDTLPDNMRKPVDDAIENNAKKILYSLGVNKLRSTKAGEAANMFSNKLLIGGARETIDIGQGYINKIYNSGLLPGKRNFMMNMMLPGYGLYRNYLNEKLENTQIGQQTKQVRDIALKAVFDWTERGDQKLANLEGYKYATKKQEEWSDKGKGIRDAIDEGRWDVVATNVGETAGQMLPSLIMAFVTKDPKIAAGGIFTTVFGSSYKRSLLEVNNNPEFANLTTDQKDNLATSMAVVEAGIETLGDVIELAPFMKGKSFSIANMFGIKNALLRAVVEWQGASVIEGGEEVLTEILQNAFKRAYGGSDRATAEELGQIFSDTYFIMQFLGLLGGIKGGIETHRRNTAEKLLAHEAEGFDDFEEFLESAHRGGVEDDELIADAWATSKGLTNEERAAIKKDTANIQKQENNARELYEEKQNIESQLTQLRLTPTENETQIKKLETRLQEIDNNINEIDSKINEYMNLYGPQGTVEVIEQQEQQPTPQQQGGENLSQQTMSMAPVQKEINKIEKKQDKRKSVDVLSSDFVDNELPNMLDKHGKGVDDKSAQWLADNLDDSSLLYLKRYLEFEKNNIPVSDRTKYNNLLENVKKAEQISKQVKEELKSLRKGDISSSQSFNDFLDKTAKAGENGHLDEFVLTELNNGLHILGLKGVNIKSTEGKITEETAKRFSRMIARMSQTFGIDFNKVVNGIIFELTETEGKDMGQVDKDYEGFGGFLTQVYPKEVLEKLRDATGRDLDNRPLLKAEYGLLRAGIALAINGTEQYAAPTLAHEFIHLLELRKALDDGLDLHIERFDTIGHVAWQAVLEGENSWKTFKINKGASQYRIDYLNAPSEILARYGQQYYAYKNDMEEFNRLTDEEGFWPKEAFDKLIDKFESVMEDEFGAYELDSGNKNYADIMEKLDNNKLYEDERWLRNFKESGQEMTDRIENKMIEMQKEYLDLKKKIDGLEGDIAEEIRNGYRVTISMLESNTAMLAKMGPDYIDITTNTASQQESINNGVNRVSDDGPELISEVEDNQQEGDIIDDAMKEEIEENKEPDTTEPLDVAVNNVVNKVEKSVDKMIKDKSKKNAIREVGQGIKDVFTPALSRLYSISPRLAGAVHVYQASVGLKTLGYKRLSENFVKALDKLKKKNPQAYKKLSLALFDWGMDESIDIKQSLKDAGLDEKLFEPVVSILNQIATEYQSAGLDITINDKYFPRKVKDYGLLLDYLSRKSGKDIEGTKQDLLNRIKNINEDPSLSDGEKEVRIHNILINEFTKPSERSNNAKERKLVLSERLLTDEERKQGYKNDITDFYEDPIVSLSNYIDDMVKKTELKKMLGGLTSEKTAISEEFDDSIAKIILDMETRGELTPEKADEAKKVIKSIVNARATGRGAQGIKNAVYSMTIANRLSAAQQLEDLSKALLRGPTGFKNMVKSIIGKANIKMDDTGLENAFAQFEGGNITDTLFKLSGFDAVDALGKNSFLNTAYDSCVRQANSGRRSIILKTRLTQMYGEEMGNSIFESYKDNQLRDEDGHLKLDVMVDLMYQLGNTQPIYKSAMPTAYLNNPKIRVVYCLWSFTVKQVDWFIQGTKEVYNNQRLLGRSKEIASMAATGRCIGALSVVSIISAMVADLINWAKGDDDELMLKKLEEDGFGAFLKQFGINSLSGLLKIFNISKYDQYVFKREGIGGVLMSKITPAPLSIFSDIGQVLLGKEELASIGKYMPLFLKPLYYQFKNRDMLPDFKLWGGSTGKKESNTSGGSRYSSSSGGSRYSSSDSGGSRYSK